MQRHFLDPISPGQLELHIQRGQQGANQAALPPAHHTGQTELHGLLTGEGALPLPIPGHEELVLRHGRDLDRTQRGFQEICAISHNIPSRSTAVRYSLSWRSTSAVETPLAVPSVAESLRRRPLQARSPVCQRTTG